MPAKLNLGRFSYFLSKPEPLRDQDAAEGENFGVMIAETAVDCRDEERVRRESHEGYA